MATITLGTTGQTSLNPAIKFLPGFNSGMASADAASVCNAIKNDIGNLHSIISGSFGSNGLLYIPNRGVLKVLPGDYVGVSSRGFPYLVSADDIANGNWVHS